MKNFNKILALILTVIAILAVCTGCTQKADPVTVSEQVDVSTNANSEVAPEAAEEETKEIGPATLSEEDKSLLEAMGPDIVVLDDETFAVNVTELIHHVGAFNGFVYQLEGVYTAELDEEGNPYVYRTLVNGDESTVAALPLVYLTKDIAEGSWIRVTAIIGTAEINGVESTVLEVVTIENDDPGAAELAWSGSEHAHAH